MDDVSADFFGGFIVQTLTSVGIIYLIRKLGLFKNAGFQGKAEKIWLIWPGLLFVLFMVSDLLTGNLVIDFRYPIRIILYIMVYLSTGLFEETLYRGLVYQLLIKKWGTSVRGCYSAVILSSAMFGSVHLIHFLLGHSSITATLAQMTYATFIGVFMCAVFVRCKSIYPVIILHGVIDIAGDLNAIAVGGGIDKSYKTMDVLSAIILCLIVLPLFIYGLIILKKEYKKNIDR